MPIDWIRFMGIIILVTVIVSIAFTAGWYFSTHAFERRRKKTHAIAVAQNKKYEQIIRKLEEEPQAYAIGLGASFVLNTIKGTVATIEEELEKAGTNGS